MLLPAHMISICTLLTVSRVVYALCYRVANYIPTRLVAIAIYFTEMSNIFPVRVSNCEIRYRRR